MSQHPLSEWIDDHIAYIWSYDAKVEYERRLWLVVMEEQRRLGLPIPAQAIDDYRVRVHQIDKDSILKREAVTRHDVKARIEEFNSLAGHEFVHWGMTSADVVDNVALIQMRDSLMRLEFMGFRGSNEVVGRIPFRGIKGAVGTQQDQVDLLGSTDKADELDQAVAERMGFDSLLNSVGQVYHRSIDYQIVSHVVSLASARFSGNPLLALLAGYQSMVAGYQGHTWNEGDVSQSVVRRVALPGTFYTASALYNATQA